MRIVTLALLLRSHGRIVSYITSPLSFAPSAGGFSDAATLAKFDQPKPVLK